LTDSVRIRKAQSQEAEIDRLREEATEASDEYARLAAETLEAHRHEAELDTLVGRLRTDAQVQEHQLAMLRDRLATVDLEFETVRAVRDALTYASSHESTRPRYSQANRTARNGPPSEATNASTRALSSASSPPPRRRTPAPTAPRRGGSAPRLPLAEPRSTALPGR